MKKSLAILAAVGLASAASAQSLEIEPASDTINPGQSITLTVFGDSGPADYAIAGVNFSVNATGGEWTDRRHHIGPRQGPAPAQNPGVIAGSSVTGISLGQLDPLFGFEPEPGRIRLWSGDWNSATEGVFDISTTTTRMEVYTTDQPPTGGWPRRAVTPGEGRSQITVIPAPASLALLGLGGLAAARRRR